MKNMKRLIALGISATMVLGSSLVAFAADSTGETGGASSTGTGSNEGVVDKEVYSVTLPTVSDNTYNFILDPDELLKDGTEAGKKYADATFSGSTNMYFLTSTNTYSEKSAAAKVINNSAVDVDVTMEVEVTSFDGLQIDEDATIDGTAPAMNLALVGKVSEDATNSGSVTAGDENTTWVDSEGKLSVTTKLTSDVADYKKVYDTSAWVYKAEESSHASTEYEFYLTGGCNTTEDVEWTSTETAVQPSVEVTWSYAKHVDAPPAPSYTEETAYGSWSDGSLWIGKDASTGFDGESVTVEISTKGGEFTTIASTYNSKWVSVTWSDIESKLESPSDSYDIRVTDGTTRYTYSYIAE